MTTDSASSRRATNASACADAPSSHCASSITHNSGRSSAASDSRPSTARPTNNRSGRGALAQPERDFQRVALRSGKSLKAIAQRRAQLMQRRECQLHLRLHPRRTYDAHVRGRPDRIIEQRRLPDSCLTSYYEHTAAPSPCSLTQPIEDRAFSSPTAQGQLPGRWLTDRHKNAILKASFAPMCDS